MHQQESTTLSNLEDAVLISINCTGNNPKKDRIIEVAALKVDLGNLDNLEQLEVKYFLKRVNPEQPIPAQTQSLTGIKERDLKNEPPFRDIAQELRNFIADHALVAHNARWQSRMLQAELERAGQKGLEHNPVLCTQQRLAHYLRQLQAQNVNLPLVQATRLFSGAKKTDDPKEAFPKAYQNLQLTLALRAMDDLPGSAQERWHKYFENFQPQPSCSSQRSPWTRLAALIPGRSNFFSYAVQKTSKFILLFLLGFLLAGIFLRIVGN